MERKLVIYYEADDSIDEDELIDYVHLFFCKNPNDPEVGDCRLHAMTAQNVVEEE